MKALQSRKYINDRAIVTLLLLGLVGSTVAGCGGSGGSNHHSLDSVHLATNRSTGRATFTIRWPETTATSRLIPVRSESIVIEIFYQDAVIDSKRVERDPNKPQEEVTFENLPLDMVKVRATAYPTREGTGVAQAVGAQDVAITADTHLDLEMGSTISHLDLTPANDTVRGGQTLTLTATAFAGDAVVLTSPAKIVWTSSDPSLATVNAGVVTANGDNRTGNVTITVVEQESGKSATRVLNITEPPAPGASAAQFNPFDSEFAARAVPGGLIASGDNYTFDTNTAILTNTTKGIRVAEGQLVTRTFGVDRKTMTYAVFTFAGDIHIGGGSVFTGRGANPVVLLTQGGFTLDGGAKLDVSADGSTPGAGGSGVKSGPGAGGSTFSPSSPAGQVPIYAFGGGGFGGRGGGDTFMGKSVLFGGPAYGADFADPKTPHLQGGSGGYIVGAGGGALYIAAAGKLSVSNGIITANGGTTINSQPGSGGSGGGIVLWAGQAVTFDQATINVAGGNGRGTGRLLGHGGGGGRVLIGYPAISTPPTTSFINVRGGSGGFSNSGGQSGVVSTGTFNGF